MAKKKIYKTAIAADTANRRAFQHFLRNIGSPDVSFNLRGGYFVVNIDMSDFSDKEFGETRKVLNKHISDFL